LALLANLSSSVDELTYLKADNALFLSLKKLNKAKMNEKSMIREGRRVGIELPKYGTLIID
jgi:hypothetical protein